MWRRSVSHAGGQGFAGSSTSSLDFDDQAICGVYVTANDLLTLTVYSFITSSLTLQYRLTTADNTVVSGSGTLQFTAGTPALLQLPLQEGYLTAVCVAGGYPPYILRGDAFAVCSIPSMVLFQDYLQTDLLQGWPGGRQLSSVEGPGAINFLTLPNPPAGQDWTFQIPTNTKWLLHSVAMLFATSAASNQRLVSFVIDGGSHGKFSTIEPQSPSTSVNYQLARGSGFASVSPNWGGTANQGFTLIPAGLPLPLIGSSGIRGMSIGTLTTGLNAGDQWSQIGLMYEQWYQDSA